LGAGLGPRGGRCGSLEREQRVDIGRRIAEAPYAKRGDEDEELDACGREMRDDRLDRLRPEREGGHGSLDEKEHRKTDARLEAALASPRDHQRDDGVEDGEDVRDLSEVVVLAGEPGRPARIDAIEEAVDDKKDR